MAAVFFTPDGGADRLGAGEELLDTGSAQGIRRLLCSFPVIIDSRFLEMRCETAVMAARYVESLRGEEISALLARLFARRECRAAGRRSRAAP